MKASDRLYKLISSGADKRDDLNFLIEALNLKIEALEEERILTVKALEECHLIKEHRSNESK